MTVHLVDGSVELFRCFHGAPALQDAGGTEVGAARGLLWTLTKLLRTDGVTHVAVVFDAMAPPRRSDRGPDAQLRGQFRLAVEVCRALGLATWTAARGQADDVLASAAAVLPGEVVICSTDRDLWQCVRGRRVVAWDRIRDRVLDEDGVRERLGVAPALVPDLAALAGDPSDGLPGVPGWGARSAAAVLSAHGGLDAIPDDAASWRARPRGAERLAESLRRHRDDARLVRQVATLRTDLVPSLDPETLRWRGPRAELPALAARLGAEDAPGKLPQP